MAVYYYDYDFPPPLVDHIHQRTHQHHTLLEHLLHQKPRPEDRPNQPDVDIRDAPSTYLVEVEVPGVGNEDIRVHWITSRTLTITGEVVRPGDTKEEVKIETDAEKDPSSAKDDQGLTEKSNVHAPVMLVGERRLGPFRRVINFPSDVDMNHVAVRLEAGLLRIRVPKKLSVDPKQVQVLVEG